LHNQPSSIFEAQTLRALAQCGKDFARAFPAQPHPTSAENHLSPSKDGGRHSEQRNMPSGREKALRDLFRVGLFLKAAHSLIELASGVALYLVSNESILSLTRALTRHELLEDPNDVVATFLLRTAESLSIGRKSAAVIYLLSHGTIELFLVVMVLKKKPWAYPLFMIALGWLIAYQTYQLSLHWSPLLIALTALDLAVLVLTWHEYRLSRVGPPSN
jgi:uncharacterized membrane protein